MTSAPCEHPRAAPARSPALSRPSLRGVRAERGGPGALAASAAAAACAVLLAAGSAPAAAQGSAGAGQHQARPDTTSGAAVDARSPAARSWSFPVGERAVYDVRVALGSVPSPRPLGEARLTVEGTEPVDGTPTYRTSLEVEGGIPLVYRMENRQVSWIAPDPIRSLRYLERLREGDYRRHRRYRLDQEAGTFTRYDRVDGTWRRVAERTGVAMPDDALDEVSFLYFVRSLPLEPGETYRYERFFEPDGNPVVLEVLGRERIRVPAGTFETVVVRPILQTDGLFAEGGQARVWITDDRRRIIVKIESSMKVGRVDMHLRSYESGESSGP